MKSLFLVIPLALSLGGIGQVGQAKTVALELKPNRCIALHQGQTCYQTVKFNWIMPAQTKYCLHQTGVPKALVCWQGNTLQNYTLKFAAAEAVQFQIKPFSSQRVLVEETFNVVWVYKSQRKNTSNWRLF